MRRCAFLCSLFVIASLSGADEPLPKPVTWMVEPSKQLFQDRMSEAMTNDWRASKGKWEVVDKSWKGSELKDDNHGGVIRRNVAFKTGVISFDFKLEGAKQISLSLNGSKGHISRVQINGKGFSVRKDDQDGKTGDDKAEVLQTVDTKFEAGKWYTMIVEVNGKEIIARVDDKLAAWGRHDKIDAPKTNVGLTVAGESVFYRNMQVWEGTPKKDWDKKREELKKK